MDTPKSKLVKSPNNGFIHIPRIGDSFLSDYSDGDSYSPSECRKEPPMTRYVQCSSTPRPKRRTEAERVIETENELLHWHRERLRLKAKLLRIKDMELAARMQVLNRRLEAIRASPISEIDFSLSPVAKHPKAEPEIGYSSSADLSTPSLRNIKEVPMSPVKKQKTQKKDRSKNINRKLDYRSKYPPCGTPASTIQQSYRGYFEVNRAIQSESSYRSKFDIDFSVPQDSQSYIDNYSVDFSGKGRCSFDKSYFESTEPSETRYYCDSFEVVDPYSVRQRYTPYLIRSKRNLNFYFKDIKMGEELQSTDV